MEQGFTLIDPTKPQRTRKPFKPKVYWTPKDVMAHYQVVGPGKTQRVEPEKMERWFARQQGV